MRLLRFQQQGEGGEGGLGPSHHHQHHQRLQRVEEEEQERALKGLFQIEQQPDAEEVRFNEVIIFYRFSSLTASTLHNVYTCSGLRLYRRAFSALTFDGWSLYKSPDFGNNRNTGLSDGLIQ